MASKRRKKDSASSLEGSKLVERDLTAQARQGLLPEGHGLDGAVAELVSLLERGGKAPLLAGEPGVGKTAIVQELARRAVAGQAGSPLRSARIVEVPAAGVFARAASPRQAAELLEGLFDQLAAEPFVVVYMRDVGQVLGSSLAPVLIRALRSGRLRFVFEAELRRAQELLRSDEALAERLHLLVVQEPTPDRARWILGRVAEELELGTGIPLEAGACDMSLRLSSKFLLARRLPRKAIELLRETAAEAAAGAKERIGAEEVLSRFCAATRLPRFVVDDALPLDLAAMERFFGERILGQSEPVGAVLRSVALLKAGLNDPRRPLGAFLFCGPTGVGKTHLAKLVAEFLFGSAERLVRMNMADFAAEGDESVAFGNPWANTLEGRRGELARLLEGKVFAVLLLDEFEKAHPSCHDRFLQLVDEGRFVNAAGETVLCNNVLIVATSNVGAEVYREPPMGFPGTRSPEELRAEVDRRIAEAFRAEFLNRFDAVCHFQPLGKVEIRRIAQREVGRVLERDGIQARGLEVEVAQDVVDLLVERGYSPFFGARFLQREIEKTLTTALAVEIARARLSPGAAVKVSVRRGVVVATAEQAPRKDRAPTAQVALPTAGASVERKRLGRIELIEQAQTLVGRAGELSLATGRAELEQRQRRLLAASSSPGFWDDSTKAAATLREFRTVDSKLADLDRLRELCQLALRRAREAKTEALLASAGRAVEEAGREVQLAAARLAAGESAAVDEALLDISAAVDGAAAEAWLGELAHLYLGWAERRGYEASLLAEARHPARVVLHLSGPGVLGFLAGERGLHRRLDERERVAALVRLHRPLTELADRPGLSLEAKDVRRRPGRWLERVTSELTARDEDSGRQLSLEGAVSVAELRGVGAVLLDGRGDVHDEARRYHLGRGARVEDPRTGVSTPRVKDVLRGEIDAFIAAWVSRPPGEQAMSVPSAVAEQGV